MTTQTPKTNGSNPDVGFVVGGSASAHDLPSFWIALCRYRERHGLTDPQNTQPILEDTDLKDLREDAAARDFSFDDADFPQR